MVPVVDLLVLSALGFSCQQTPIPVAATETGTENRICFFGSEEAFALAYRQAVKAAGCTTIDGAAPSCHCPAAVPATACSDWGINLFRLYRPISGTEAPEISALANTAAAACSTFGGVAGPGNGLEPDGLVPACHRTGTADGPNVAVYTAYMIVTTVVASFLLFEFNRNDRLLEQKKA